ncbi:conserved hypothetical protein [[Clostridium] ultunense Esp]|nr:conserved hypothetical protein [[Clostridium] ultunense Esp]
MTLAKVTNISNEMKKLKDILKLVPEDKLPIAKSLYSELEFMQKTLNTLKQQIEEQGPTAMFKQGKQQFLREHPALKAYNVTLKNYNNTYKQLTDLLPKTEKKKDDPLLDFIKGN